MRLPEEILVAGSDRVGIGEYATGGRQDRFYVALGSCVGVCVVWKSAARFAVAHVLLPNKGNSASHHLDSRFGDTVVPFLIKALGGPEEGRDLCAYIAGGAQMYANSGGAKAVGDSNIEAVLAGLKAHRVRVVASDLGGVLPRQLVVHGPSRSVASLSLDTLPTAISWELPHKFNPSPMLDKSRSEQTVSHRLKP